MRRRELAVPLGCWFFTGLGILLTIEFSLAVVKPCTEHPDHISRVDIPTAMSAWDGRWNVDIIRHGYADRINWQDLNPAAFPPLYPLLGSLLTLAGMREENALLLVSNASFLGFLVVFYIYCRDSRLREKHAALAVLLVAISPYSHFFRMAYTESLFCLLVVVFLLGIRRSWHPLVLALVVALASTTRVVGIVLIPILFCAAVQHFLLRMSQLKWLRAAIITSVGLMGVASFMIHLDYAQGDPFAMFKAQDGWTIRPEDGLGEKILNAVSGQPLIDAYRLDCPCYWGNKPPRTLPLFNMQFWNPVILIACGLLTIIGWRKGQLTWYESTYCTLVIAVPYFTQGYRICLHSQSRYALAAFPLALVVVWILRGYNDVVTWLLISLCSLLLFANTALFVGWYFNY